MNISETYNYFKKITNFDIEKLFSDFVNFVNQDANNVINYYNLTADINVDSFNKLFDLIKRSKRCIEVITIHKKIFTDYKYWNILIQTEDILNKLKTIENIGFYLRSPITKNDLRANGIERDFILRTTLENISLRDLQNEDFDNNWFEIAKYNDLNEEKYYAGQKKILQYVVKTNLSKKYLDSVLGILRGEALYGVDLDKKLTFVTNATDGTTDLKVLSPKETANQSVDIYLNLSRGDNPEFPDDGIQKELFIGTDMAGLKIPILFRQLTNIFTKDDTFSSFSIINAKIEGDGLFVDFQIDTFYNLQIKEKKQI
jgi:hypothetical protein